MSRKSSGSPPVVPGRVAKGGKRRMPILRNSPARSASWFLPVRRSSKAGRPARTFKSYDEMDPTLVDQMALINATPLGVDEVTVPVGIEGLRQDWFHVGELLRNAIHRARSPEPGRLGRSVP